MIFTVPDLSQLMRLWYLSHRRPAKVEASLRGCQSLCCSEYWHTWSMEVDEGSDQKSDIYPRWIAAHAHLKNEFTEDEKCHYLMRWLIFYYHNDPKFSDWQVWANSADQDRSSLIRVYTVCHSAFTFRKHYPMVKPPCSNFRVTAAIFRVSEYLGILYYSYLARDVNGIKLRICVKSRPQSNIIVTPLKYSMKHGLLGLFDKQHWNERQISVGNCPLWVSKYKSWH